MLGMFLARDVLAFALFWDLMLLPVFFALLGWGEHRIDRVALFHL